MDLSCLFDIFVPTFTQIPMPAKKVAATGPAATPATKKPPVKAPAAKAPAAKAPAAVKPLAVPSPKKTASKKIVAVTAAPTKRASAPAEPAAPAKIPTTPPHPTRDEIAHAAYLIFLRRKQLGLPGDSATDWLEAERQLGRA